MTRALPTLSVLVAWCMCLPRVVAGSNPGLELANAFGVMCDHPQGCRRLSSPGLSQALIPRVVAGSHPQGCRRLSPPGLSQALTPRVVAGITLRVVAGFNPGLELANAFGVN